MAAPKDLKGKIPLQLLPAQPIALVAEVIEYGASKYGRNNWREGLDWTELAGAALRHIFKWLSGENFDKESGLHHLAHAASNLLYLLEWARTGAGKDDRWKG